MFKNFILSTLIIWIYFIFIIYKTGFKNANQVWEPLMMISAFFLPALLLFVVVLPIVNIYIVNRKKEKSDKNFLIGCAYFFIAWLLFYILIEGASATANWLENRILYGNNVEEAKVELMQKAELSIEDRYNKKYELIEYWDYNSAKFLKATYSLQYKDEGCTKDCFATSFSLSHEKDGWRLKKLETGEIWYLEEKSK